MDDKTKASYEAKAAVIKAMAHPSRLYIVDALSQQERCVAELTGMVGSDMSTVSKHLSVLKGVGIIADEKRGTQVYYRLRMPCVMNFFSCVESVLKDTALQQLRLVE